MTCSKCGFDGRWMQFRLHDAEKIRVGLLNERDNYYLEKTRLFQETERLQKNIDYVEGENKSLCEKLSKATKQLYVPFSSIEATPTIIERLDRIERILHIYGIRSDEQS